MRDTGLYSLKTTIRAFAAAHSVRNPLSLGVGAALRTIPMPRWAHSTRSADDDILKKTASNFIPSGNDGCLRIPVDEYRGKFCIAR